MQSESQEPQKNAQVEEGVHAGSSHKRVVSSLTRFVGEGRMLAFDAVGGIRDSRTWLLVNESVSTVARDFCYNERFSRQIKLSYAIETLETVAARGAQDRRRSLVDDILRRPPMEEGKAELRRWLKAVTGREDDTDFAVMLHWLWLVKRGLAQLPPEHHIMPILSGCQGSGKTTALRKLLSPLHELAMMPCDASILTDEKRAPALATYAVAVLDELQGVSKADAEALKQTLTAETKSYRPMRTNTTATVPVRCRFIGATNEPVQGLVNDVTGARRFYDLACADTIDRETVNTLCYELLWSAVSENDEAPIVPQLAMVQKRQSDLKRTDSVSEWLEEETWLVQTVMLEAAPKPVDGDEKPTPLTDMTQLREGGWIPSKAARALYTRFCENRKEPALGLSVWGRRLKSEGVIAQREADGPRRPGYRVPAVRQGRQG